MAFPFETEEIITEDILTIPKEYEIDFATGQFTGNIVEGVEAVKVWIYNTLRVQRYKYVIFSWDYGKELDDLIGQSFTQEYLEIEAKRMIEECLLVNENITSIDDFMVSLNDENLTISFTASTLFGEVEINV